MGSLVRSERVAPGSSGDHVLDQGDSASDRHGEPLPGRMVMACESPEFGLNQHLPANPPQGRLGPRGAGNVRKERALNGGGGRSSTRPFLVTNAPAAG